MNFLLFIFINIFLTNSIIYADDSSTPVVEEKNELNEYKRSWDMRDEISHLPGYTEEMKHDYLDESPLTQAARLGKEDVVKVLIEKGVELKNSIEAQHALVWAVIEKHQPIVDLLLKNGVSPDSKMTLLGSALTQAARNGDASIVQLLLGYGANPTPSGNDDAPLYYALLFGNKKVFDMLLDAGSDVNKSDMHGNVPLHAARTDEQVRKLIKRGAIIYRRNSNKETPVIRIAEFGAISALGELLKAGANVNDKTHYDVTALHNAAFGFHADVVLLLLKKKADSNAKDYWGKVPLSYILDRYERMSAKYQEEYKADMLKVLSILEPITDLSVDDSKWYATQSLQTRLNNFKRDFYLK